MEKMLELKRDLAKGNEIIARFGSDLEKCKSDLKNYQDELRRSREKVSHSFSSHFHSILLS